MVKSEISPKVTSRNFLKARMWVSQGFAVMIGVPKGTIYSFLSKIGSNQIHQQKNRFPYENQLFLGFSGVDKIRQVWTLKEGIGLRLGYESKDYKRHFAFLFKYYNPFQILTKAKLEKLDFALSIGFFLQKLEATNG